ncbi:3-oxo-5a-steroid 4- dehydrogenase [Linderina pennispora]|nr:3-oxo-5a-steroid 4- dehydrogenase [Linderina pennispora]
MKLVIAKRGGASAPSSTPSRYPLTIEVGDNATVDDVKKAVHKQVKSMYPDRQRLTVGDKKTVLASGDSLAKYELKDNDTIHIKDLGPQVGWTTVFLVEYFGPLLFHFLIYNMQTLVYGKTFEYSDIQRRAYYMAMGHFLKRELETIFVHRFSNGTMPIINIFKNSFHYHILSGVNLAYWVYSPSLGKDTELGTKLSNPTLLAIWTVIFVFAELSNLSTHITLRNLRPAGTRTRRIPFGYGFDLVSCPNYLFESLAWTAFACMTRSIAAFLFLAVSTAQMYVWAVKKHKAYRREFPDYPKSRKAMFPFVA